MLLQINSISTSEIKKNWKLANLNVNWATKRFFRSVIISVSDCLASAPWELLWKTDLCFLIRFTAYNLIRRVISHYRQPQVLMLLHKSSVCPSIKTHWHHLRASSTTNENFFKTWILQKKLHFLSLQIFWQIRVLLQIMIWVQFENSICRGALILCLFSVFFMIFNENCIFY